MRKSRLAWAPNVETFLTKLGTVWVDYLSYQACGASPIVAPPGSPMVQVSPITGPQAWDPALGPLWLRATASILTSRDTDPRNSNFRYELRHEYQILDPGTRQAVAGLSGVGSVDLTSAPRGGYLVPVPVATSWNGTLSTGEVIPTGIYPLELGVSLVRVQIRNGQEKLIGGARTTGTLAVIKCMKILTPESGAWLGGRDYKTTPTTIKFLVLDTDTCNKTTRVNFDLRLPPGGPDILGASGATQPFEDETKYHNPHDDTTQWPLSYPGLTIDKVEYATVPLGTLSFSGRVVTALLSLPPYHYQDSPAQLFARLSDAAGQDYGGDAISLNYDTAGPQLFERGTFVADDDFDDVGTVQRICVEASEPLASIDVNVRPVGTTAWILTSLEAHAASAQHTVFGTYIYCWDDATVPGTDGATDGYDYEIQAYDEHGNPSAALPGQVRCQVPERFVVPDGQRVGMTVDKHNVPHVVYTTPNAVRYVRWSHDSWGPVWRYPDADSTNVWGEPVWCLYGWAYRGTANDRAYWDCRDKLPDEPEKQWGAKVDIAIGPDGQPAVCAVFGPKVTSGTWLGDEYGTVAVFQRPASAPSPQPFPWTWSPVYNEDARYYNCALVGSAPVFGPPSSNRPPGSALALMFTTPHATAATFNAAPAFSVIDSLHIGGFEIVDDRSSGLDVAMTAAPDGTIHAVYTDVFPTAYGAAALHHAYGGPGEWTAEVVQSFTPKWWSFPRLPSIARDSAGQLHVSYSVQRSGILMWVAERELAYVRRPPVPSAWEAPEQVDGDLPGVEHPGDDPYLDGIPSRVVMGRDPSGDERVEIVYFSGTRRRKEIEIPKDPQLAQPDVAQLVLAYNPKAGQNPGWHSYTLASRVDESTGLAAATSPTGRRRVAYHNGLAGQLFYEQEENGNMTFAGPYYLPAAVGCAARGRDPGGASRPRFVATDDDPVPGDLMNLPVGRTRAKYEDKVDLFRDLRRYGYGWIDNVPKPTTETPDWSRIDENVGDNQILITQTGHQQNPPKLYMGDLLFLANQLLGQFHEAQCPPGADTSLGGCWRAAIGPPWDFGVNWDSYRWAPDVAQESIIESTFRNVRLKAGQVPMLEAKGVCVPAAPCDQLKEREWALWRNPQTPPQQLYAASRAFPYDPSQPLAVQIAACAALVDTYGLGDARLVVGRGVPIGSGDPPAAGSGCYWCWPSAWAPDASALWLGLTHGDNQPYCGPPTCPTGGSPVGRSRQLLTCEALGCTFIGCAEDCKAATGTSWPGDEGFVDIGDDGMCSRCPSGYAPAGCVGGDKTPRLPDGVDHAVCQSGTWRPWVGCNFDTTCDAVNGYTCQGDWCRANDSDKTHQGAPWPYCVPTGCQDCFRNLYCVDDATSDFEPCLDITHNGADATCTKCPNGHVCTSQRWEDPQVAAPLCFGRPFLDDFRVHAALTYAAAGEVSDLTSGMMGLFGRIRFPTSSGGHDLSVDERVEGGGFRFGGGPFNQGYLEFLIRFKDDFEVTASATPGTSCTAKAEAPVIMRLRLQPFFAADNTNVPTPPHYHGTTRWRVTDATLIHDLATGERSKSVGKCVADPINQKFASMEQDLYAAARYNMEPGIESLWRRLTEDMIVGGWLFGREAAIRALHTAQDSIPIDSTPPRDDGDGDPAAMVEALRLWPPPDPQSPKGGSAVMWYRQR